MLGGGLWLGHVCGIFGGLFSFFSSSFPLHPFAGTSMHLIRSLKAASCQRAYPAASSSPTTTLILK
jgi:hypothetical protein